MIILKRYVLLSFRAVSNSDTFNGQFGNCDWLKFLEMFILRDLDRSVWSDLDLQPSVADPLGSSDFGRGNQSENFGRKVLRISTENLKKTMQSEVIYLS